jgi:RND family efflux transporter, MFP subunit
MTPGSESGVELGMKISSVLLLVTGVLVGGAASYAWLAHQAVAVSATSAAKKPAAHKILYYRNPMGQPDTSPVPKKDSMGMDYIPVYADEVKAKPKERTILYYRNPMGQPDTSPVPKKDSMGMDYIPVYADAAPVEKGAVMIDASRRQNLGVTSVAVKTAKLTRAIKAVGVFAVDERRQYTITSKLDGWVDKLYVNSTGQTVKAGQPLFELYSPELIVAQQEYRIARQNKLDPAAQQRSPAGLGNAALTRLRYWDIPESAIRRLAEGGDVKRTLPIDAPITGVVLTKNITQGMKFSAGEALYQIADLSTIWLLADVFEQDLAAVQEGQTVQVKVNAYPAETFTGKLAFVYPTMNTQTRTVQVRVELNNSQGKLKPGMYAEAQLQVPVSADGQLVIPESALIDSGSRQVVLIDEGNGKYVPRKVQVLARGEMQQGERQIAVSGVKAGEKVVTQANFLIDSESNLQAAFSSMGGQ